MPQAHWRDCQAWRDQGVPLSTTSNEAAKLYDAAISQIFRHRDDPTLGGVEGTVKSIKEADPNFVMGHILSTGMPVLTNDKTFQNDPDLQKTLDDLVALSQRPEVPWREKCYVDATVHWANRRMSEAEDIYDQILLEHPRDDIALLMGAFLSHFYQGQRARYRDISARLLNYWTPDSPNYGFLNSFVSFGMVETNCYPLAEEYGRKALSINLNDSWATHSMSHVFECTSKSRDGINFLTQTEKDWTDSTFAHHIYWHWALMHIDQNEHDAALGIFDSYVKPMCVKANEMFAMPDYSSLLKRLELEGVNVGDRWQDVREIIRPHLDGHRLIFYDYHLAMGCLGLKDDELTKKFMDSLHDFVENGSGDIHTKIKRYGAQLIQSLVAYDEGDYARAVDLLYPVRYEFATTMSGSNAQNDILALYLIHASLQSPEPKHNKLARQLIAERKVMLPGSPMGERLAARVLAQHID